MRGLLIALGVFAGATVISKMVANSAGVGKSMGELGVNWRGHSNSSGGGAIWSRDIDSRRAQWVMSSKIRSWGTNTLRNAY